MIDLRSDTITQPSPEMRQAIATAAVGDDVLGDDPTVIALERRVAERLGKEASLLVPSGTMANQICIHAHTRPGDEVIADANAHCYYYEGGAPAALSGVTFRLIDGPRGIFDADQLQSALRPDNVHFANTSLVCIENTHNRGGGSVWPFGTLVEVCNEAHVRGLKVHMDGARLWNASVASGVSEAELSAFTDTVSVCFSKALGAPIGSAVAGTAAFIDEARRIRKRLGGGMRQAGIIAAGAIHALQHNRDRLADDHRNAQTLAEGLSALSAVTIDPASVETNIVYFDVPDLDTADLVDRLSEVGVALLATGPHTLRAVTSLEVSADDVASAIEALGSILR